MDRTRTFLILALTLPLIGALAAGCNTGTEEPDAPQTDQATQAATDATGESDEPATSSGSAEQDTIDPSRFPTLADGVEAAVPDNYPKDLPMYPGAVPAQGRGQTGDGGDIAGVQLLTNDSPDETYGYYQDQLESKGWSIERTDDSEAGKAISVTKDGCKAILMFAPSESGTGTDIFTISSCDDA